MSQGFLTPNHVVGLIQRSVLIVLWFVLLTLALSALLLGCLAVYNETLDPKVVHSDYLWVVPWVSTILLWAYCIFGVTRTGKQDKKKVHSWFDISMMFTGIFVSGLALWILGPLMVILAGSSLVVTVGGVVVGIICVIVVLGLLGFL